MIFLTGDIHRSIDIGKLAADRFPLQKELTKNDYVIILGDFGCVWDGSKEDKYWQNWLNDKPFTTLFVDGNHENFDLLNAYPVEEWNGGKIHKIADSVFHLMRGQCFTIDGMTFFTMGGARSHDKMYRREGESWWPQELLSKEDMDEAIRTMERVNWDVDFILTHCAPDSVQDAMYPYYEHDICTNFLEHIKSQANYGAWFFGHYHADGQIDDEHFAFYNKMMKLEKIEEGETENDCATPGS